MKTIKTSELTGAALDWAVAKCEEPIGGYKAWVQSDLDKGILHGTCYSSDWLWGGPIIEREMIQLTPHCMVNPLHGWSAAFRSFDEEDYVYALHRMRGKTPLIAAMRCYVASKLGGKVDVPDELAV